MYVPSCTHCTIVSAHISAIAYCIKLEVDISKRTSFGIKYIGHEILKNRPKNDPSQKSYLKEKSVLSCLSTSRWIFLFSFMLWLYFHDWFLKLYKARAKLCYLRGQSFLDQNLFFCLCLPPVWCSKRLLKYGLTLM